MYRCSRTLRSEISRSYGSDSPAFHFEIGISRYMTDERSDYMFIFRVVQPRLRSRSTCLHRGGLWLAVARLARIDGAKSSRNVGKVCDHVSRMENWIAGTFGPTNFPSAKHRDARRRGDFCGSVNSLTSRKIDSVVIGRRGARSHKGTRRTLSERT